MKRYSSLTHILVLFLAIGFFGGLSGELLAQGIDSLPEVPKLRAGKTLSLADAIKLADNNNRSLQATKIDIEIAKSKLKASWALLLPNLYGNVNYTLNDHADFSTQSGQSVETRTKHELRAGLQAAMPIIDAQKWMGIRAALTERDYADIGIEQTRQELLFAVAEVYLQTATQRAIIEVYRNQQDSIKRNLSIATSRFRTGIGSALEIKRSETDLISIRESIIKATFAFEDARDALAVLIGQNDPPLPKGKIHEIPEDLNEEVQTENRWDLLKAKKSVELADKQLAAQWMQFLPSLNASWQYNYSIERADALAGTDKDRWFAGLVLSVPLFNYNFYPKLQSQRYALKKAKLLAEELELGAKKEISMAKRYGEQTMILINTATLKAKLADETLQLAQIEYANGDGSALTVIDAQRTSQNAHIDLETRQLDMTLSRLLYLKSLGTNVFEIIK